MKVMGGLVTTNQEYSLLRESGYMHFLSLVPKRGLGTRLAFSMIPLACDIPTHKFFFVFFFVLFCFVFLFVFFSIIILVIILHDTQRIQE